MFGLGHRSAATCCRAWSASPEPRLDCEESCQPGHSTAFCRVTLELPGRVSHQRRNRLGSLGQARSPAPPPVHLLHPARLAAQRARSDWTVTARRSPSPAAPRGTRPVRHSSARASRVHGERFGRRCGRSIRRALHPRAAPPTPHVLMNAVTAGGRRERLSDVTTPAVRLCPILSARRRHAAGVEVTWESQRSRALATNRVDFLPLMFESTGPRPTSTDPCQ